MCIQLYLLKDIYYFHHNFIKSSGKQVLNGIYIWYDFKEKCNFQRRQGIIFDNKNISYTHIHVYMGVYFCMCLLVSQISWIPTLKALPFPIYTLGDHDAFPYSFMKVFFFEWVYKWMVIEKVILLILCQTLFQMKYKTV